MKISGLDEIDAERDACFGGKALGLARLRAAGARVPPGFAIAATTTAPASWEEAHREELKRRATELLRDARLAVRSSALVEDSEQRSFAGLFETVLDVQHAELLAAVQRCIASGASDRVQAYAGRGETLAVGVVVQPMIAARAAGVCFTADPLGLDRALVIEAVPGTGDALVSGRAQPERWRVYRTGLGTWEPRREAKGGGEDVLSASQAVEAAREAAELAARLGRPLDLEWAIDREGTLWWLQARPITTSATPPEYVIRRYVDDVDDGPVSVWSNWNLREVAPEPFPPLAWTLWRDVVLPSVCEPMFGVPRSSPIFPHVVAVDLVHGRIYWNMNALLAAPLFGRFFGRALRTIDARAGSVLEGLIASGVLQRRRLPGSSVALAAGILWTSLRGAKGLAAALRPKRLLAEMAARASEIARRGELSGLSDEELLQEMRLLALPDSEPFRNGQQAMGAGFVVFGLAERAFKPYPEARRLLTAGISDNPTTEISIGIDELVEAARPIAGFFQPPLPAAELLERLRNDPAGAAWPPRLEGFLARFGHRCPNEFDLSAPRWSEDPSMVLGLVRAGLAAPPSESVAARLQRLGREREKAVAAAVRAAAPWRRPMLRLLARLVAEFMPLREAPKHHAMNAYARMRLAALTLGARFARRGLIESAEDVLFLEWPEVQAFARGEAVAADWRRLVDERRKSFARFHAERAPDFLRSDGVPVEELEPPRDDGILRGIGASGGRAVGPARVLREPDPEALTTGDVLVVELADPGWTPLFPRAAAVVMEVGGVMCHAAVIARELGIPGVFGVAGATRLLANGRSVAVDGDAGTVAFCDD